MARGFEGQTVDMDELAAWLDRARGLEMTFPPLEPHQLRLLDTMGVVVTEEAGGVEGSSGKPAGERMELPGQEVGLTASSVSTMIERVPEDKQLVNHLRRYSELRAEGWVTTALRDHTRKPPTVVLLACRE